nr:phage tail domain-containing protein [Nocardiopsis mwathae]
MPEYEYYRRESGVLDGDQVAGVRALPREVFLPIRVHGESRRDIIDRRRALARDLDPFPAHGGGAGTITVTEFDGTRRRITAHYEGGAEGDMGRDHEGLTWATLGLKFRCEQPYWELDPVELIYRGPTGDDGTWLPILPVRVRDSTAIGPGMPIRIEGGVRTWPVWELKGPLGPGVRLANRTTGKWLEIDRAIGEGETLVIDTRPRRKSVRLDGANAYRYLTQPGSTLWPLRPGDNTIDAETGQMSDNSRLVLRYTPIAATC